MGLAVALAALEAALRVARLDPHPNGRAHAILAQALYDGLRSLPPA